MGWFRDTFWLNSSQLDHGYPPVRTENNLAVCGLDVLFGSPGSGRQDFMFLISWRGYWQE